MPQRLTGLTCQSRLRGRLRLAQIEEEGAHRGTPPGRRVVGRIEVPRALAVREQAGPRGYIRREVAMDVARTLLADEPRLELVEAGVVAAFDVIEKGHRRGK